jgi:hypothetical protein
MVQGKIKRVVATLAALPWCVAVVAALAAPQAAVAQAGVQLLLCKSNSTGAVVSRIKCRQGETRINPQASQFQGCYWRLGTPVSLAGLTGLVTITESCTANDVLVNHSVFHSNRTNALVSVNSYEFISASGAAHSLPQGIRVRLNLHSSFNPPIPEGEKVNAEVNLLCCPF